MRPFEFVAGESVMVVAALLEDASGAMIIAGGTDLMGEIKESVVSPDRLVSLLDIQELRGITTSAEGLRIGAMTTVAEVESHSEITSDYAALAQAAASVATPQIRNVGTVGGNLCQRPRCWYYRSPLFDCLKKGGNICFAVEGNNKYHAIMGGADCHIVHPSDLAVALITLNAEANVTGVHGSSTIPLEDFFVGPEQNVMGENVLKPGEILTSVFVPRIAANYRSIYLKAKERQAMDFALSSAALALELEGGVIRDARITLGGVAPTPYRVLHAEDALKGKSLTEASPEEIGQLAVQGARPLRDNHYKVRLASSLVSRAVRTLIETSGTS